MMQFKLLLWVLVLFIFSSCAKEPTSTIDRDFAFPAIPKVISNDGNTVGFSGKIDQLGNEEILEYGFVWNTFFSSPSTTYTKVHRDSFIFQGQPGKDKFEYTSTDQFGTNFTYQVRIFVKTSERVVYGPQIKFISSGTQNNPWEYIRHGGNLGTRISHGFQVDFPPNLLSTPQAVYLTTANSFYKFREDENEFRELESVGSRERLVSFYAKDLLSAVEPENNKLRYLDVDDQKWNLSTSGNLAPYDPFDHPVSVSVGDGGYLVDKGLFLKYELKFNSFNFFADWDQLPAINSNNSVRGIIVNPEQTALITITENKKMWKWDIVNEGEWEVVGIVPFEVGKQLLTLKVQGETYMGFSSPNLGNNTESLWRFNFDDFSWKEIPNFPLEISLSHDIVSANTDTKGYIGTFEVPYEYGFSMWSFDPSKIN